MKSSHKYYRWLCLVSLGLAAGCGLSNQLPNNLTNTIDPLTQMRANLEQVGTDLQTEDSKIAIKKILQQKTNLYSTDSLSYPIVNYSTLRTKLFGQYQNGVYQTGDTITIPASDQMTSLMAVSSGRILQIGSSNNLGQFLVLEFVYNHITYHMIYSQLNNTTVTVQVGDTVAIGQTIVTITGSEPHNVQFALYPFTGIDLFADQVSTLSELKLWMDPFDFIRQVETK